MHIVIKQSIFFLFKAGLWACLLCPSSFISAQMREPIEALSRQDNNGGYQVSCSNFDHCSYIVTISLNQMDNLTKPVEFPYMFTMKPGKRHILSLTRVDPHNKASLHFATNYHKGCLQTTVDASIVHTLPVSPIGDAEIFMSDNITEKFGGKAAPEDLYAFGIKLNAGDTIYATRRGIVTISNDSKMNGNLVSTEIEVFHKDCSFSKYMVTKSGGVLINTGEKVEVGDPIAVTSSDSDFNNHHLIFSNYQASIREVNIANRGPRSLVSWSYIKPNFITKIGKVVLEPNTTYQPVQISDDLITQEMSKKEIKRWIKSKGK